MKTLQFQTLIQVLENEMDKNNLPYYLSSIIEICDNSEYIKNLVFNNSDTIKEILYFYLKSKIRQIEEFRYDLVSPSDWEQMARDISKGQSFTYGYTNPRRNNKYNTQKLLPYYNFLNISQLNFRPISITGSLPKSGTKFTLLKFTGGRNGVSTTPFFGEIPKQNLYKKMIKVIDFRLGHMEFEECYFIINDYNDYNDNKILFKSKNIKEQLNDIFDKIDLDVVENIENIKIIEKNGENIILLCSRYTYYI